MHSEILGWGRPPRSRSPGKNPSDRYVKHQLYALTAFSDELPLLVDLRLEPAVGVRMGHERSSI